MPRTRTSWVITPVPHTPSWRAQEHLHLYLPSPPTPAKQLLPFSTCMHYPPILSVPHVLSAFICHRNDIIERYKLWSWYKEPQVFRSTPQRLAASMFSNARLCVNKKKKACLRPSFVEQYFRISTSARISDSVYNTLHGVHVPIRNSAPLYGRLLFPPFHLVKLAIRNSIMYASELSIQPVSTIMSAS